MDFFKPDSNPGFISIAPIIGTLSSTYGTRTKKKKWISSVEHTYIGHHVLGIAIC